MDGNAHYFTRKVRNKQFCKSHISSTCFPACGAAENGNRYIGFLVNLLSFVKSSLLGRNIRIIPVDCFEFTACMDSVYGTR